MSDKVVDQITGRWNDWNSWSKPFLSDLKDYAERWLGIPQSSGGRIGFANTHDLEFHRSNESLATAMMTVIFSDDPWFVGISDNFTDRKAELKASRSAAVIRKQQDLTNFKGKVRRVLRNHVLNGTHVAANHWEYRTRWVDGATFGQPDRIVPIPRIDVTDYRNVPLDRFAVRPGCTGLHDSGWCIEREPMTREQLVSLGRAAERMGNAAVKSLKQLEAKPMKMEESEDEQVSQVDMGLSGLSNMETYDVKKYWGYHPTDPDKPGTYLIVVVNDMEWFAVMPSPYRHGLAPYTHGRLMVPPGTETFYGVGLGKIASELHEEIVENNNLENDLLTWALFGPMMTDSPNPPQRRLRVRPGELFLQQEWGNLKPLMETNFAFLPHVQNMQQRRRDDLRQGTKAPATQQGLAEDVSATDVRVISSAAARAVSELAEDFAGDSLRPHLLMSNENNRDPRLLERGVIVQIGNLPRERVDGMNAEELLADELEVEFKLAQDIENRPQMIRRLSSAIQAFATGAKADPRVGAFIVPAAERMSALLGSDIRGIDLDAFVRSLPAPTPEQPPAEVAPAVQ